MVAIMHSVAPQQTVTFRSGSHGMPLNARTLAAMASRSGGAPQVMAYWLKPSWMASTGGVLDLLRGLEVGHALAEVDRPVPGGQPGHLADDGLGKVPDAVGQLHG